MERLNTESLSELAPLLLASPEAGTRAALLANAVTEALPGSACVLYRLQDIQEESFWVALAASGEVIIADPMIPASTGIFASLSASLSGPAETVIHAAKDLAREEYAHIHVTRTIRSIAYVPLLADGSVLGAIEVLAFSEDLTHRALASLQPLAELASAAILSSEAYEQQRQDHLDSIHRLTQLYDLEKSLNATLELEPLMELVPVKIAAILPCQAIHLWLFDSGVLRLMAQHGSDATVEVGAAAEDYVAEMAEEGEPLLISDAEDPRLAERNQRSADSDVSGSDVPAIINVLLVPLIQDGAEIGVLEALNKEGEPFDDDDLFFLNAMAETVSSALKNASLMFAERKLEILETLVHVSSEITSTLRLDHLLQIIVNSPQSVLPFERCSIALDNRGKLQLKAVSGMPAIPTGDVQVEQLRKILEWLARRDGQLLVRQHDEEPEHEDAEVRAALKRHFEESGYRAIFALPLTDDQGRLGLLLYESSDPDFLEVAHIEMIKVLAGQTTVAIRNALLYREVPLISLLEPLIHHKQSFLRSDRRRRWTWLGAAAAVAAFLVFCPFPLRISGGAVVAPEHIVTVAVPVDGTIKNVNAREGQHVMRGFVLGSMDDWEWRSELAVAQARYEAAMLAMQNDLAAHAAQAGQDRTQVDYLRSEMERARARMENAQLRSPIDGIVVTPDLLNATGKHLNAGDPFAQVLDLSSAMINVAIDEQDAPLVKAGQSAAIKLNSFPSRIWHGDVEIVSPEAQPLDGRRVFYARVRMPNGNADLRAGMDGRAKIFAGYRPAGFVLLRQPALWIWQTLWNWIGW